VDADRWQRLSPLLDAVLEMAPEARAHRLAGLRQDDPGLATELESLLELGEHNADFLAEPLLQPAAGACPQAEVGPYRLERLLGEGGMGQVWLASRADGLYQKRVALKLLRPGLANPDLRLRFTRERQILARLEHAHIARLLDAGISADSQPYLALEYVDGEPITDWCQARARTVAQRIRLFLQVCGAVSHAHANLIVHRDLKPSNILVTPLDEVRLLDFGIAKLLDTPEHAPENTRTGLRTFTLHYAAPEQIRGEPVTTMTDVYSLGVVLYELVVDAKPYRLKRHSDAEWEEAILAVDPMRPSLALQRRADEGGPEAAALRRRARQVAGDLDNIVLKALAKRPEQRYPSVEALALDLRRLLDGKPVQARRQSMLYRTRKFASRNRWVLATTLLVATVMLAALGIIAWQAQQAVRESARAQAMQSFVVGLFESAGASGGDVRLDMRALLDAGVRRGDQELAQQPLARAELFGVIARLRTSLGDYEPALALLHRQRAIIEGLDTVPPSLRLQASTDLGLTTRLLGRPQDCVELMRPWHALALREVQRLPVQASGFLAQLGRCHRGDSRRDAARADLQRALDIRRRPPRDEAGIVEILADLAGLHADTGNSARAIRELDAALAVLEAQVGHRHPLGVELRRNLCSMQREQGRPHAAERECRAALALAVALHGTQHRATIDARRQLAALLVDQGRLAEAGVEFRDAQAWMVARLGRDHPDVARNMNSLAIVAWERGDFDSAIAGLRQAVATWRAPGPRQRLAGGLFNLAMVLHDAGRSGQARPLLLEALQLRRAEFGPAHGVVGDTLRLLGEVEAALGQDTADASLASAVRITAASYGAVHPHTRRAELSRARWLARRDPATAARQLGTLAALPAHDDELRKIVWEARAAQAELQCAGDGPAAARTAFDALRTALREARPEGGVVVRHVEAAASRCRLRAGAGPSPLRRPAAAAPAGAPPAPRPARSS